MITTLLAMILMQAPDAVIDRIGLDQRLGASVDLNLPFRDETGAPVQLGAFFGRRPVILTPVYYDCPMLCSMQLSGLVRALKVMPFSAGKEFEIVTFSFDPSESADLARSHKDRYIRDYGRTGAPAGWHFLTGDAASIQSLTRAIGFRYMYDQTTGQWAHVSAILVLTPAGRISQYLNGIEHDPQSLKYSLIEASGERIGSLADHILLFCYQYDPKSGKYSLVIMRVVRIAGVLTLLGIAAFMLRNQRFQALRG
jgi:protein SCO1/2